MEAHRRRNFALDLVRATEAAALSAADEMGCGIDYEIDRSATNAMFDVLNTFDLAGEVVLGEEGKMRGHGEATSGQSVGTGHGPAMDVLMDPIDGRRLLANLRPGALAVAALAPHGTVWRPKPALYMEKLVVDSDVAHALVPECLEAPAAWTLGLIARHKGKPVRDLIVFVLERRRHQDLIEELRTAGARVMLRLDGDISGSIHAASLDRGVDALFGVGGVLEGLLSACAVKALNGAMLARLRPQSEEEREAIKAAGLDERRIWTHNDMVSGNEVYFAATGITDGPILRGVRHHDQRAHTQSLILRAETHTRRFLDSEHPIGGPL